MNSDDYYYEETEAFDYYYKEPEFKGILLGGNWIHGTKKYPDPQDLFIYPIRLESVLKNE